MTDAIAGLIRDHAVVTAVARAATGRPHAEVDPATVRVTAVPVVAMATGGLARVRGTVADRDGRTGWSVVVKVVQSPDRSPIWTQIPPEFHAITLAQVPWRTEPDLYGSALPDALPDGLRMPAIHRVDEIDDRSAAIWMEDVTEVGGPWTPDDHRRAGRLLGRLAGRFPADAPPVPLRLRQADLRHYFTGRVSHAVLPALRDDAVWAHPLIATVVDARLRGDLLALAEDGATVLDLVDGLPRTLAHGDACPQNLLRCVDGDLVAVDWQLAGWCALGFDVGQLVAGHAESGDLHPVELPAVYDAAVAGYTAGVADEGLDVTAGEVALGAAGVLVIRSAFTALPLEFLDAEPSAAIVRLFDRRARYARFLVDLARTHLPLTRPRDAAR